MKIKARNKETNSLSQRFSQRAMKTYVDSIVAYYMFSMYRSNLFKANLKCYLTVLSLTELLLIVTIQLKHHKYTF